ncbi:hypothetical protein ASE67_06855 [Sphingomonas sp. Leaf23]|uniref:N-6 DNA methylase n=1 Tax=Sphingomonas sp. Leaf23 TaxID=1735689 RepID=UPI0006F58B29|nr:N-6 DNA methylase [Sphingomonas sp. Leaf23]KQM87423.1 hypothetical protein ASE67_06855 [Sphingomonas sp. Leaf23]
MQAIAAPRNGRSLEGQVAPRRQHVLAAVDAASSLGAGAAWLAGAGRHDEIQGDERMRAAWAITALLLVDMARTGLHADPTRASEWFGSPIEAESAAAVALALAPLAGDPSLQRFLPYLLDTYGRTTRLDVMRDGGLEGKRAERKKAGSFYTPADVADFMVSTIASDEPEAGEWWLDPAVGSGVFLAAVLRRRIVSGTVDAVDFAATRLIGCDISPQACDFASFVILSEMADRVREPLRAWRAIRDNMHAVNSISRSRRGDMRAALAPSDGPLRMICNPPYGAGSASGATTSDGRATGAMYLPFVELSWCVAHGERDATTMVVPLSLGANRTADHRRCRTRMAAAGGQWTLLFFDRQPHALFGEEAKTRATIATRRPGATPADIRTSRLLKWTSRSRASIFTEDRAVPLEDSAIGRLVPKLGSSAEATLYRLLDAHRLRAGARAEADRTTPSEIAGDTSPSSVFVAGTAYNFLNVYRGLPALPAGAGEMSASGVHRLSCADAEEADVVTALLVSRMAFWLWHVECDGFHVPAWFLSECPLLNVRFSPDDRARLAAAGRAAWAGLQEDSIQSVNRGKLTIAFRPTEIAGVRTEIDRLLAARLGAGPGTADLLADFERQIVSIDGTVRLSRTSFVPGATR